MTSRYFAFTDALARSSSIVTWIFIAAALTLTAYSVLTWLPPVIRSGAKRVYTFSILFIFVLVIILQARAMFAR